MLVARREDRLRALAEETGGEVELCDVADREAVEAMAARVLERHPRDRPAREQRRCPGRTDFLDGDPAAIEA